MKARCDRCGYMAPLTGDWFTDGGTLIQHMEDAHTPDAVEEAGAGSYDSAIEVLRTNGRKVQMSASGIGWIPTDTFAGAIRLLEHHRPEQGEKS